MKKWIWKLFKVGFHLICITAVIFLSRDCILHYHENRNTLHVLDRKFQTNNSSVYPTISLCFSSPFKTNLLDGYGKRFTPLKYSNFLMGKSEYSASLASVSFNNVTIRLEDFLFSANLSTKNIGADQEEKSVNSSISTLNVNVIVWRFLKCFSFNIPYEEHVIINQLSIILNRNVFPNKTRPMDGWSNYLGMSIFYHLPNQLLNSYQTRKIMWPTEPARSYAVIVYVSNIEIKIRRRKNFDTCTTVSNYDEWIIRNIISSASCFPHYWKSYSHVPECNTTNQLRKISEDLWNVFYGKDFVSPPCKSMTHINVEYLDSEAWNTKPENSLYFSIFFRENSYKEVKQVRAYEGKDLFGDVGGINGFWLGYALVQLPNFLSTIFLMLQFIKRFISNSFSLRKASVNCIEDIKEKEKGNPSFSESILKNDDKSVYRNGKSSNDAKVIQTQGVNELEQILCQISLLNNKVGKLEREIMTQHCEFKNIKKELQGLTKISEIQII